MISNDYHAPVLVDEVLHYLQPSRDGLYVDGTLGGAGHAEEILMNSSSHSLLIGFDADQMAIDHAQGRLSRFGDRVRYIHDNFVNLRSHLMNSGVQYIEGLLLDLGVSSRQLDFAERGFSFQKDSRIDMRTDCRQSLDGWFVVNNYDQTKLSDILWLYGEERNARKIAKAIAETRKKHPVDTTAQLSRIVESVTGARFLQKSLARVFQAIRIEVNHELENLKRVLQDSVGLLARGGRIVVISYHSLEDRAVKQFFKSESQTTLPSKTKLLPAQMLEPRLKVLTKKPVTPGVAEASRNPRAQSAKLRAAERI